MQSQFDQIVERKNTNCSKWDFQGGDFLPMWVADMDFKAPEPILEAVRKRLEHGVFGYGSIQDKAASSIVAHYKKLYDVDIKKEWIVWVPSVMPGANLACRLGGGDLIYSIPMYTHIRRLPQEARAGVIEVPLKQEGMRFTMDFDALEKAITPETKVFVLCNPHNPVGRVFTHEELSEVTDFAKKHDLLVVSDEIHCELVLEGRHIPFFSVNDWAKSHSITLSSAGKISNIPSLPSGYAIIPDDELRTRYKDICLGLFGSQNALAFEALNASYNGSCDEWKEELRAYLRKNRDYMEERLAGLGLPVVHNEGTYLAWIDVRGEKIEDPFTFFRKKAGVHFNDGATYGQVGKGYVRLNYGCPKSQLTEALDRVEKAIREHREKGENENVRNN